MERVQVRFPKKQLKRLRKDVKKGEYPSLSEAIRDKVRKSYILEAVLEMREATEEIERENALKELEKTREEIYGKLKKSSN